MKQKKKHLGIRVKLIGIIIPIVLIMVVIFFALARNTIIQLSMEQLESSSNVYAKELGAWTEGIFSELEIYKHTIDSGCFENDDKILAYMQTTAEKHEAYPAGLYMGDDSGIYLDGSGWVPGSDWILTERDWYVDGSDNETIAFGEPYYDSQTGDVCVSASVRMNYDKAVRVMAVDVYLNYLSEIVSNILEDNIDTAFFVTKNSKTILAHSETEMIDVTLDSADIDSLYSNINSAIDAGKIHQAVLVKGSQGDFYVNINEIANTDWYLITGIEKAKVLAELSQLEFIMILVAVVAAVCLILLSMKFINGIIKPVENITHILNTVAEGDFTQKIEPKGNDEIAGMSKNMQYFLEKMRMTLVDISQISEQLSNHSEDNERLSTELKDSSVQQSAYVDVLHQMTTELSLAAADVSKEMNQLSAAISDAESVGNQATEMMNQTVVVSENGKNAMLRVNSGMNNIQRMIESLSEQIQRADDVTKNVADMVDMIKEIAEETNLLSLNASIEAARAGQAGRGFAVVAEQINSLAISSASTADKIEQLTLEIGEAMKNASTQMAQSVSEVANNTAVVTETSNIFGMVFDNVAQTNASISKMVELVNDINKVATNMNEIASIQLTTTQQMEESANELEIYSKTIEQNSDTVADNAKSLEQESESLIDKIRQFTV